MTSNSIKYANYPINILQGWQTGYCKNCSKFGDFYKCKFEKTRLFRRSGPEPYDAGCSDFENRYDQNQIAQAITVRQLSNEL